MTELKLPPLQCPDGPIPEALAYNLHVIRACAVVLLAAVLCACSRNAPNVSAAPAQEPVKAAVPEAPALFDGQRALDLTRAVVAFGPRPVGSPGYLKTQAFLRAQLNGDNLEEDTFSAGSPRRRMTNFIAKFPGSKNGIILVAGHYDTKPLKNFVGANDGGSSTGLPLELASQLRAQLKGGKLPGYSVWVVWLDGEESMQESNQMDFSNSTFGSQHLAGKWQRDGTLKDIKAFLLVDMVGDADLNIDRDSNSTPWLEDVVAAAAAGLGYQSHFFARSEAMEDDHIPFARAGVPVADLIDFTYGPDNAYWHSPQDTMDKLSAESLKVVGSVVLGTIQLLNNPKS